ncbi:hypothetical protein ACFQ71_13210 [Streptomyces sp. NPDC056534]|uniref:hypothetical protein n=1 Tax=Streptomyces sp. NPDC056534 TaxID=3345857 RepID=UPI00369234B3
MTTPSVWSSVPELTQAEELLRATKERLQALPPSLSPDEARQAVLDAAVSALVRDGEAKFPLDIGERAVEAHTAALAPHSERTALRLAIATLQRRMPYLKMRGATTALTALAAQLDDVVSEARAIVERSGHLDGDAAIEGGEQGIADYRRLRDLVDVVNEIRRTQRSVYQETGDAGVLSSLYREGHDEFRGVRGLPLPADVLDVVQGRKRRGVPFLIFMAESGRAWVATSVEELTDEARAAEDLGVPDDGANPFWHREAPAPQPSQPARTRI